MEPVLIFGAGGHGKVVLDIVERQGLMKVLGMVDDVNPLALEQEFLGKYPVFTTRSLRDLSCKSGIVAVGDNWSRALWEKAILDLIPDFRFVSAIHPNAVVAHDVAVGDGTVIMAGAVINSGCRLGRSAIVNTHATVDHDCELGDYASLGPGSTIGGNVSIADYAAVALGACVQHRINIGTHAVVGTGSVVVRDVAPFVTAYGTPCKPVRRRQQGEPYL